MAIAAFVIYMPIEAYQTAKARLMGVAAPDPFGLNNLFGNPPPASAVVPPAAAPGAAPGVASAVPVEGQPYAEEAASGSQIPIGAFVLIGLGVLFLLNTFGWMHFDWVISRFWPLILIAVGIRVLMKRNRMGY